MSPAVWGAEGWRAQAVAWLDEQLAVVGAVRTGEVEQPHLKPWATALKVPTSRGIVWLKAAGAGTAFEVALYGVLCRVVPERVLTRIAADVSRGWIVLPDGGPLLGDGAREDLPDALVAVMPEYARLQRDLTPHVDALLAAGVTDMRPAIMPTRFDEACSVADAPPVERRDVFVEWCEQLAAAPASPTLDHNDLHIWNILAPPNGRNPAKFSLRHFGHPRGRPTNLARPRRLPRALQRSRPPPPTARGIRALMPNQQSNPHPDVGTRHERLGSKKVSTAPQPQNLPASPPPCSILF